MIRLVQFTKTSTLHACLAVGLGLGVGCSDRPASEGPAPEATVVVPLVEGGIVVGEAIAEVVSPVQGILSRVPENGSIVEPDTLLFEIEQETLEEDIEQAQDSVDHRLLDVEINRKRFELDAENRGDRLATDRLELKTVQLVYSNAVSGLNENERRLLDIDIELAKHSLDEAKDDLARETRLVKRGFQTARSLEPLERAVQTAETRLQESKLRKDLALRPLPEDERLRLLAEVKRMESTVHRAEETWERSKERLNADLAYQEERLRDSRENKDRLVKKRDGSKVCAGASGVVQLRQRFQSMGRGWTTPEIGTEIWDNDVIADIIDPSRMWIELAIPETGERLVEVGMDVKVRLAAFPGKKLKGTVIQRADTAQDRSSMSLMLSSDIPNGQAWYRVRVSFESEGLELHPGMSAVVEFPAGDTRL